MSDIKWFADSEIEAAVNKQKNDLRKAGLQIERDAKILCPVDTGRLRASIHMSERQVGDTYIVEVGTNVKYAPFLSFGTRHMKAHPFLRPAFDRALARLRR